MQVTSPLKRRFASATTIAQSYALTLEQTFKFPLRRLDDVAAQAEANRLAVRELAARLGASDPMFTDNKGPVWRNVGPDVVLHFLREYRVDDRSRSFSPELVCAYIERLAGAGELTRWVIAIRGRESADERLGTADWGLPGGPVAQVSRSRLGDTESLGVITSPGDEAVALSEELRQAARILVETARKGGRTKSENNAAREVRDPCDGLLLLYPISRFSGCDLREPGGGRRQLYADPEGPLARDLVGLAISFPRSNQHQSVDAYLEGTVRWRPAE